MEIEPVFYCITNPMGINQPYSHPTPSKMLAEQAAAIENKYHQQANDGLTSEVIGLYVIPDDCRLINKKLLKMLEAVMGEALKVFNTEEGSEEESDAVVDMCMVIRTHDIP